MSPRTQARKSPKLLTRRSLSTASLSTLSHSPGYLVNYAVSYPAGNRAGCSPGNPVRNPESYLDGYLACYRAGYSPENLASYSGNYRDSNSADHSAHCPDNRRERNAESNRESNEVDYSEIYLVDSVPDCLASYQESFDLGPVCRAAAGTMLLQLDDLADSAELEACGLRLFEDEVHSARQCPHTIGAPSFGNTPT
jgi:hypothetical protein